MDRFPPPIWPRGPQRPQRLEQASGVYTTNIKYSLLMENPLLKREVYNLG